MIEGLKPYQSYKPGAMTWLGSIPAHWMERRAKYFYREVDERSASGQEELMSVSHITGVTPRKQNVTMFLAESNVGHKICRPDDLVINTMWAFMGALGVAKQRGIVSPSYGVYRPLAPSELHPEYVDRLLRTEQYKSEYLCRSTGIHSSRLRLYPDQFLRIPILCPPAAEQMAIVRFLDHVDRRVRRYIRAKRQLIALLNEQKQAVIHRAVTRGLDTNVRLKPSGADWQPEMPENFNRTNLARLCISIRDGTHNPPPAVSGIHRLLSVRNIVDERFVLRDDDRTMTPEAFSELQRSYTVEEGDVVLALVGGTTGKSAVVEPMENVTVQRSLGILRPKPEQLDSHYLRYVISSQLVQSQIRQIMDKYAAQPGIYLQDVGGLQILFPDMKCQRDIVSFVRKKTASLQRLVSANQQHIELILQYRTRLIADIVTGKLDVREAAARLPDEAEEPVAVDEAPLEGDEGIDDAELDAEPEEIEA